MSDTTNIAATLQGIREEAPIDGFIRDLEFAVFGKDGNTWERSRLEAVRVLFGRAVAFGAAAAHEREASALEAARQEIATLQAATEAQHTAWNRENDLRHDAEAQVDALTRAQADWRPIETAPEAEWVSVYLPGLYPVTAIRTTSRGEVAWFLAATGDGHGVRLQPTHWRPLAAPPGEKAAERVTVDALTAALRELKRGDCWCEVGIGNPNMGGRHSSACRKVAVLLDRTGAGGAPADGCSSVGQAEG
jgi:hypothetical protein